MLVSKTERSTSTADRARAWRADRHSRSARPSACAIRDDNPHEGGNRNAPSNDPVLKAYPKASATIDGHTDGKGDEAYNQKLSERRAESVRAWLAAHGASLGMATRGWGKKKPIAPNAKPDGKDDPEGRQKNRRVEIAVKTR